MALANLYDKIVEGPFLIFMGLTSEFPVDPYAALATERDADTNQLKPDVSDFPSFALVAYTSGAAGFKRTPTVNSFDFNEITASPAVERFASEATTVDFTSPTIFYKNFLENVAGVYADQRTLSGDIVHIAYPGKLQLTTTKGVMLVSEKQYDGKPFIVAIPNISISSELAASVEKGQLAQSTVTMKALPTADRPTWWIHNHFAA